MDTRAHRERRQDCFYDEVEIDGKTVEVPRAYEHIDITKIVLATLKCLNAWHQLDTYLLYKLVEKEVGTLNYNWFQHVLTKMRKKAGYIFCPPDQFLTINPDYKRLTYQLTDRGQTILKKSGVRVTKLGEYGLRWSEFAHDWMTTHNVGSLYLTSVDPYISPQVIADRAPVKKDPFRFKFEEIDILPDFSLFGYVRPNFDLFLIWEQDCNTESIATVLVPKLIGYHNLLQTDYFEKRLDIPTPYVCINTTNKTHMGNIQAELKKRVGKSERLLFRTIEHFSTLEHTPDPVTDIWNIAWQRVGYDPITISDLEE